jgi:hypothetical protein
MERKDLLLANAQIFSAQGKALDAAASRDVRVLVVGNPANTNALIAASNAPGLERQNFTAMMRLDHNRALGQLATKTGKHVTEIRRMIVWGNHSATQHPDIAHCTVAGKPAKSLVDQAWYRDEFIPTVQTAWRGRHQGARLFVRGLRGLRRDRPHARLGARHAGRRLGQHGRAVRRQLRHRRGRHLFLSRDLQGRKVRRRAGPRGRRVQPRAHGRDAQELLEERDGVKELI